MSRLSKGTLNDIVDKENNTGRIESIDWMVISVCKPFRSVWEGERNAIERNKKDDFLKNI